MKFENFHSEYVGDLGVFQLLAVLIAGLSTFTGSDTIANNFIGGYQEHWCAIPELQDVPHYRQKQIAIPLNDDGEYDTCYAYKLNYSQYTMTDFYTWNASDHVTDDVMPCTDWVYDQSDYVSTATSQWDLVCDNSWKTAFLSTTMMAGYLVGSLLCGMLSDRLGRIPALFIFLFIRLTANFVSCYAPNYAALATCRFFTGVGIISTWLISYVYVAETAAGKGRVIATQTVYIFCCLGYAIVPVYAYFIRDFRYLVMMFAWPVLFLILGFGFRVGYGGNVDVTNRIWPESPHWLMVHGKWRKAERSLRKIAAVNGRVYPEHVNLQTLERPQYTAVQSASGRSPWKLLLFNARLAVRLAVIGAIWFTASLVYWAMSLNTSLLEGNIYLNTFLISLVDVPAIIIAYFTINWPPIGRRLTTGGSLLCACATSFLTIPFITYNLGTWVTAMSLIGKCFVSMCFTTVYLYSAELLPTEVRNAGLGFASVCARVSGMAAPFIGGPLAEVWAPLPSIIFGSTSLVVGILCIWLLPETLGKTLPQTVEELLGASSETSSTDQEVIIKDSSILTPDTTKTYISFENNKELVYGDDNVNRTGSFCIAETEFNERL